MRTPLIPLITALTVLGAIPIASGILGGDENSEVGIAAGGEVPPQSPKSRKLTKRQRETREAFDQWRKYGKFFKGGLTCEKHVELVAAALDDPSFELGLQDMFTQLVFCQAREQHYPDILAEARTYVGYFEEACYEDGWRGWSNPDTDSGVWCNFSFDENVVEEGGEDGKGKLVVRLYDGTIDGIDVQTIPGFDQALMRFQFLSPQLFCTYMQGELQIARLRHIPLNCDTPDRVCRFSVDEVCGVTHDCCDDDGIVDPVCFSAERGEGWDDSENLSDDDDLDIDVDTEPDPCLFPDDLDDDEYEDFGCGGDEEEFEYWEEWEKEYWEGGLEGDVEEEDTEYENEDESYE